MATIAIILWFLLSSMNQSTLPTTSAAGNASPAVDGAIAQYSERSDAVTQLTSAPPTAGCSLRFSFSPESKTVDVAGSVRYTALISNDGDASCRNVSYSVFYSENESFVSASPAPSSGSYYWYIGNLEPQMKYIARVNTQQRYVVEPAHINSEACATADNSADICPQNTIFVNSQKKASPMIGTLNQSESTRTGEYGVWVWQSPIQMTTEYISHLMSSVQENGFDTIYVTIDDYLAISVLPESAEKNGRESAYMNKLSGLVIMAASRGINIDLEGGAMDWAYEEQRWKGYALIDFVDKYNTQYPQAKVRGLQFDVEPYLLPEYQTNKGKVLLDFVTFIDAAVLRMDRVDAQFSVVIPHFYDSAQSWTPQVSYAEQTEHTFTHLLQVLEKKPGSTLIIMAYRNFFFGSDGTQELVQAEMDEVTMGNYATRIVVAQETGNVDPEYVTFHNTSMARLLNSISDIRRSFSSSRGFAGVAVHYLDPFLDLR